MLCHSCSSLIQPTTSIDPCLDQTLTTGIIEPIVGVSVDSGSGLIGLKMAIALCNPVTGYPLMVSSWVTHVVVRKQAIPPIIYFIT